MGRDRPDFGCRATEAAPDGVAFVMVNGDGLHDALGAMARAGFVRVRTVTWDRRYPGLGGGAGPDQDREHRSGRRRSRPVRRQWGAPRRRSRARVRRHRLRHRAGRAPPGKDQTRLHWDDPSLTAIVGARRPDRPTTSPPERGVSRRPLIRAWQAPKGGRSERRSFWSDARNVAGPGRAGVAASRGLCAIRRSLACRKWRGLPRRTRNTHCGRASYRSAAVPYGTMRDGRLQPEEP